MIVLINAGARQGDDDQVTTDLAAMFKSRGVDVTVWLAHGAEIVDLARRASESAAGVVVAGGGDGTVNAVASQLVGSDKKLGVLPLGTLNHLAKDLRMPLDIEAAVDVIVEGKTACIDVGEVNGRYFVNNSGLGLYPEIVRERAQQQAKGWRKWLAFVSAIGLVLWHYPVMTVRLEADGRELLRRTRVVFIGNNEYELEGFKVGSRPCLNAGMLFLYVTRQMSRWGLFRMGCRALLGNLAATQDFDALCLKEVRVNSVRRTLRVTLDGEVVTLRPPLHYRSWPAALHVIVPGTTTRPT